MKSYFIRHTKKILVPHEEINKLWDENRVAIHFPGKGEKDLESIEIKDYESDPAARIAIKCFNELKCNGGYIWAEYHTQSSVKIGKIKPNSFEYRNTIWSKDCDKPKREQGDTAILKTLQMENVKEIKSGQAMSLRAAKPRQGTIREWKNIGSKLECLVEGKPIVKNWNNLSPEQLETVCTEYPRKPDLENYPKLEHLLLPIGRTLEDVDIYGYSADTREIFAQVTHYKMSHPNCRQKIKKLKHYKNKNIYKVFFCDCDDPKKEDDILVIPTTKVFEWLKRNEMYLKTLFHDIYV